MKKIAFIFPFIFLLSCSVQKRHYQKGFYVSNHKSKSIAKKENTVTRKKEFNADDLAVKSVTLNTELNENLEASLNKNISPSKPYLPLIHNKKDDPCDKITFKNGDELNVKILEIAPYDIKYKKCDSPDGPSYIIKKSTVFMITYANGTKEVFKAEPEVKQSNNSNNNNSNKGPSVHEGAVISLVTSITGFVLFFGSIPAIIFGSLSLRKIKREPEKYTGKGMAATGIFLGVLGVILKILFFVVIFSL